MDYDFDLICIGGGSGGIATASRATLHGAKCAVVEQGHLGGTCVNLGCVPKKVMWNASEITSHIKRAADYGFTLGAMKFNWAQLVAAREAYIQRLRESYQQRFEKTGITLLQGHGSFIDQHTVVVDNTHYTAQHIVIATGGSPDIPEIPGTPHSTDSDGFFALTHWSGYLFLLHHHVRAFCYCDH